MLRAPVVCPCVPLWVLLACLWALVVCLWALVVCLWALLVCLWALLVCLWVPVVRPPRAPARASGGNAD